MRAWLALLWLLAASAVGGCQPGGRQEPIVIKFSHVVAADAPKGKAAQYFAELVEARTHGRVKVKVYPNSQLYKDREELEALQLGAVQMLAPSLAKFAPLGLHEFEVFDVPYLFDGYAALHRVTQGAIGRQMLAKLESRGIKGLAFWDNGFKQMSANTELRTLEDFRGLKMRIQASRVLDSQMRALGAVPIATAFSDAYDVLKTGVADGTENPATNFLTQRMYEVQKYLVVSNHGYLGYAVIANKKFWDELPDDVRDVLEGAMRDATAYGNEMARRENEEALVRLRTKGTVHVSELDAEQRAQWQATLSTVLSQHQSRIGKELIVSIRQQSAGAASAQP